MSHQNICALYARVSSQKQSKDRTIDSQIHTLKEKIVNDGGRLIETMIFSDAGVSGATLIRPELERLRDAISIGFAPEYCHKFSDLHINVPALSILSSDFSCPSSPGSSRLYLTVQEALTIVFLNVMTYSGHTWLALLIV